MELSSFSENIVTETMERNGDVVELKINIDAVVPEYYDVIAERLKPSMKRMEVLVKQHNEMQAEIDKHVAEEEKQAKGKRGKKPSKPIDYDAIVMQARDIQKGITEINREIFAERLTCPVALPDGTTTCLLKGWSLTENKMPIEATKANLLRLAPKAVEAIYNCVEARLETVKKRVDEGDGETSENTHSGSKAPLKLAPTG